MKFSNGCFLRRDTKVFNVFGLRSMKVEGAFANTRQATCESTRKIIMSVYVEGFRVIAKQ